MAAAVISECAAAGKWNAPSDLSRRYGLSRFGFASARTNSCPPPRPPSTVVEQTHARHTASRMQPVLFLPTARQVNWLLLVALLSLGEALYLRYLAIEYAPVSLACQAGLDTWLCATFRLTIWLYNHSAFGWVALGAALLNLLRPTILLVAVALAAGAFGLVLHNANLAGLAAALLLLSLARPAPATE
jgi:hypothetical protein